MGRDQAPRSMVGGSLTRRKGNRWCAQERRTRSRPYHCREPQQCCEARLLGTEGGASWDVMWRPMKPLLPPSVRSRTVRRRARCAAGSCGGTSSTAGCRRLTSGPIGGSTHEGLSLRRMVGQAVVVVLNKCRIRPLSRQVVGGHKCAVAMPLTCSAPAPSPAHRRGSPTSRRAACGWRTSRFASATYGTCRRARSSTARRHARAWPLPKP